MSSSQRSLSGFLFRWHRGRFIVGLGGSDRTARMRVGERYSQIEVRRGGRRLTSRLAGDGPWGQCTRSWASRNDRGRKHEEWKRKGRGERLQAEKHSQSRGRTRREGRENIRRRENTWWAGTIVTRCNDSDAIFGAPSESSHRRPFRWEAPEHLRNRGCWGVGNGLAGGV